MQKSMIKTVKYYIAIFLVLFFLGGRLGEFGRESSFFQGFLISKPIIRIGLGVNLTDIKVGSTSGMKVYEVNSNYRLLSDNAEVVHIKAGKERLAEKYVLQVAETKERQEAELIAKDLRTKIENTVYVEEDKENQLDGIFQVKVGDFLTRDEARTFVKKLNDIGIKDAWISQDEVYENKSKKLSILVNEELIDLSEDTVLYFIPSDEQSTLSFNGQRYRGIFVLKASPVGIILVNILNFEDYLKGVVPSELSPYNFYELEAQKAQAVAARTYAIKNLGLYEDLGFDLSDTPKFQLYKGMSAEHPLSSRAVEETKGEVALYNGELANALYTSSCGGKTENAENVFSGKPLPYLKSAECPFEKQDEWRLKSNNTFLPISVEGRNISREIAFLISLGVIPEEKAPLFYRESVSFEEAANWIHRALVLLDKKNDPLSGENSSLNFITLAQLIIRGMECQEEVEDFIPNSEVESLLDSFPGLKVEERKNLAFLVQSGIFPSSREIGNPERFLTRAELALSLHNAISKERNFFHQGIFRGLEDDRLELGEEYERKQFLLSTNPFLLRWLEGRCSFATQVSLQGGEEVRWLEKDGEVKLLEVIYPPDSDILDRTSKFVHWQVRKLRQELELGINEYCPIGKINDIIPQKRGVSDRIIELLIVGTESQAVVSGLKIRWTLGLKDTLFDIDREYDEEGNVSHFTFSGKGWGHGVGLCQVGSFRMAQTGADYKEILKKYYQGIKISKIY